MICYIYILIDPTTNQIRYVGKANRPEERYKNHKNKCRDKNTHKRNWLNKLRNLGFHPSIEVIDAVSVKTWKYWEKFWISYFKSIGADLINKTTGGDGLSFGNATSFKPKQGCRPVVKVDQSGKVVQRYSCCDDVGYEIATALDRKGRSAKGFMFFREATWEKLTRKELSEFIKAFKTRASFKPTAANTKSWFKSGDSAWNKGQRGYFLTGKKLATKVIQYSLEGEPVAEFRSCTEAADAMGCIPENIRRACVGKSKSAMGFKWKYKK